jgi:hypothetical protein
MSTNTRHIVKLPIKKNFFDYDFLYRGGKQGRLQSLGWEGGYNEGCKL